MSEARNDRTSGEWETLRPVENPEPPMLADRYRVVRRLGEGGMGSVWLAEDTKLDNRKVAVKMLPAVLAGKKAACRLVKQEALTAMKLSHPNIATVRTFEEDAGNPFLVMDYIEGRGLDDILGDQGALPEAVALKLLAPVAAALDYAHGKGVVHRDVKPGNVIVRKDGTPFVLDFGIAREIQETVTRMTGRSPGGTLLYMSPEQLHGRAPAPAQDVYSFAAMAYECLNGAPPFTRGKVEYQIDQDAPAPLEAGTASPELRAGIMAGLAKKPEDRPATCEEVLGLGEPARRARKAREAEEAMLRRQEANRLARKRAWEKYAKELEAKALEEERAERKLAEAQARKKREEALARALEALEQRKARVRREGWTLLLSVLAVVLAVAWWMERQKVLKDWDWKHKAACGLAKSFDYSEALDMLDEIQPKWLFCLGTNRHAAVREAWSTLAGPQRDLQNGAKKEKDARKVLIDLENAKKALYESRKSLAEEAWKDYQTERAKTEAKRAEIQMNENGVPILDGVLVATKEDVQKLLRCYDDATAGWKRTAGKLVAACAGIDAQEAAREQAEREGREAQARKERRLAIMKEISGTLGHAQKEERLAKTKLLLAEEANAGLKFGDGNASIDWENYQYYRNLAAKSGGEAIRFDETDRLPYREVDGNRVYLGEKEIRQLPETIRAAAKNWQQAAADFEKACKRHEAALQEARQNLGRAFQQAMNTENRLSALEKDARYEAVQKDRKTVPAWNHYVTFAIKANEEMDSIPWFNDREPPFPEADKLENDQLLDLYGKLRKVIFYRLNACTLLKKAYEILDEEKADAGWKAAEEEAVEMPGADTGTTPSSDVAPEGGGGGGGEEGPEVEPGFFGRTLRGVGMGLKTGMNPDRWFSQDSDADGTKEENP